MDHKQRDWKSFVLTFEPSGQHPIQSHFTLKLQIWISASKSRFSFQKFVWRNRHFTVNFPRTK